MAILHFVQNDGEISPLLVGEGKGEVLIKTTVVTLSPLTMVINPLRCYTAQPHSFQTVNGFIIVYFVKNA